MTDEKIYYCCPVVECSRSLLLENDKGLCCPNGHFFPFVEGTKIPVFVTEPENKNEYTGADAAKIHDNSLRWLFATFYTDEATFRKKLISKLHLEKGQKVLITGVGAGNDLPYLSKSLGGRGVIFAQDLSKQMLKAAVKRASADGYLSEIDINFSVGDATNLPFLDNVFDAAYHFGGLNLFSSISKGISEMNRIVKSGGRVVFGDEGVAPWLKHTEYGKMIINNNPLCSYEAPLSYLPDTARDVNLSWELGYCFYVIDFTVSNTPLHINIDVPHVGKRGGSIRTRYFGQLEGIDPYLKDRIYVEAEKRGISRVEFLEQLLRKSLNI